MLQKVSHSLHIKLLFTTWPPLTQLVFSHHTHLTFTYISLSSACRQIRHIHHSLQTLHECCVFQYSNSVNMYECVFCVLICVRVCLNTCVRCGCICVSVQYACKHACAEIWIICMYSYVYSMYAFMFACIFIRVGYVCPYLNVCESDEYACMWKRFDIPMYNQWCETVSEIVECLHGF